MEQTKDVALQLIPEVDDILDFQVTGQQVLIKPHTVDVVKTKAGLIIGEGADASVIRQNLLNSGTVVCTGKSCDEIRVGMVVYYYNSRAQGMIRQGDDLYKIFQEFDIKAFIKQ